jgi:hypothetical protein
MIELVDALPEREILSTLSKELSCPRAAEERIPVCSASMSPKAQAAA